MVATPSKATFLQMAQASARGNMTMLGSMLEGLVKGGGYAEYAGSPESNLTPARIGEWCLDTTNNQFYRAVGTADTDWTLVGSPANANRTLQFEVFDDFLGASLDTTDNWIVFAGSDGDATVAATVTAPEGQVVMGSGGAGVANDGSVMSLILLAKGSLVSLGTTVFECRVSFDQLTGTSWNFGLSDTLAEATERSLYTINSGTVADGGLTLTNAICWGFSSDATATTKWQFCHENAGTIGNSAAEEASANGPTADTYDILRIEIDSNGDARWYLNGVLEKTETTAVATTSLLIPFIGGNSADDADVATDVAIDYVYFSGYRPSSNA